MGGKEEKSFDHCCNLSLAWSPASGKDLEGLLLLWQWSCCPLQERASCRHRFSCPLSHPPASSALGSASSVPRPYAWAQALPPTCPFLAPGPWILNHSSRHKTWSRWRRAGLYSGNKHLLPFGKGGCFFFFLTHWCPERARKDLAASSSMKLGEFLQLSPRDTAVMILTRVLAKQAGGEGSMERLKWKAEMKS